MKNIALVMAAILAIAAMTVRSASTPTGNINVPAGLLLKLKIDGKPVLVPSGTECPMPAGTYAPASMTARAAGEEVGGKRDLWSITSRGPFGELAKIEIKGGATTTIDAGRPDVHFRKTPFSREGENAPFGRAKPRFRQRQGRLTPFLVR